MSAGAAAETVANLETQWPKYLVYASAAGGKFWAARRDGRGVVITAGSAETLSQRIARQERDL